MDIDYKITEYFEDNNLFDNDSSNGLVMKIHSKSLLIKGDSRDLVEFADLLVNVSKSKGKNHLHVDNLSLINNESDINEIIIEKE